MNLEPTRPKMQEFTTFTLQQSIEQREETVNQLLLHKKMGFI
jgi:hypothetical protein